MRLPTCLTLFGVLASSFVFLSQNTEAETSVYEKILAGKNIGVDPLSLAKYLGELHPTPQQRERVASLIRKLGDPTSFRSREDAMAKLLVMPRLPTDALLAATKSEDAEIRWRARNVLNIGHPEADKVMYAAFQVIAARKTPGVVAELLAAIPLCEQRYLKQSAQRATEAAARTQDTAILRAALRNENADVRVAATSAMGMALGQDAKSDLEPLLNDRDDRVKLVAARMIANMGDRKSLTTLLAMMDSNDLDVRVLAASSLRQLSGKRLGFVPYDTAENRAKIVVQWKAWVAGEGQTAKLNLPLERFESGRGYLGGNTLLAFGNNKVAEYDSTGKEIWTYKSSQPWSAEKMANGNVLIAEYGGKRVIQVSPLGKVVWEYKINRPLSAEPLDNGNVLIAQYTGVTQAIEVNPEGKIVWKHKVSGNCRDVHRVENGNTFIATGKAILEVTPQGKVVWEYTGGNCHGCQPLRNGNVLIVNISGGRVIELTREKKIVWEYKHVGASDAFRLPNGNTLVTGSSQFVEVTPDKKIVWSKEGCQYGTARR